MSKHCCLNAFFRAKNSPWTYYTKKYLTPIPYWLEHDEKKVHLHINETMFVHRI